MPAGLGPNMKKQNFWEEPNEKRHVNLQNIPWGFQNFWGP